MFELFQPDRGVILLKDQESGDLVSRVSRPLNQELVISQTIVQYALEHRTSVMVRQTAGDERFMRARSVVAQSIRAAVCCPLIRRGKDVGALYVDTQVSPLRFSEENLALFNLVAANAAIAIDNAILLEGIRLRGRVPGLPAPALRARLALLQVVLRVPAQLPAPVGEALPPPAAAGHLEARRAERDADSLRDHHVLRRALLGALQLAVIGLATLLALVSFPRIWRHVDEAVGQRAVWRGSVGGVLAAAYLRTAAGLVI